MLFRKHLFNSAEKQHIVDAIAEAEMQTSGEIRVHVEPHCPHHALKRAEEVFHTLEMHKKAKRNGVLIYLAYKDKRFAIIGDKGIHDMVPGDFWDSTKDAMAEHFKKGDFQSGVIHGIREAAKHLKTYFPYEAGDTNELSNEISEG